MKVIFQCEDATFLFSLYLYKFSIPLYSIRLSIEILLWFSCRTAHQFLSQPPTFLISLLIDFQSLSCNDTLWCDWTKCSVSGNEREFSRNIEIRYSNGNRIPTCLWVPKMLLCIFSCREQKVLSYEKSSVPHVINFYYYNILYLWCLQRTSKEIIIEPECDSTYSSHLGNSWYVIATMMQDIYSLNAWLIQDLVLWLSQH